jgi:hypothetical protein
MRFFFGRPVHLERIGAYPSPGPLVSNAVPCSRRYQAVTEKSLWEFKIQDLRFKVFKNLKFKVPQAQKPQI